MPQKPKAGDRISVTIEGIVTNPRHGDSYIAIKGQDPNNPRENIYIGLSTDAARTVKILPPDLMLARISDRRTNPMSANIGSLAIVTADEDTYVRVRWLDRSTAGNQADGAYNPNNFDFANAAQAKKIYALLDAEAQRAKNWTPPVRPLQVGDKVFQSSARSYMGVGEILYIHEDYAFVSLPDSGVGYKTHMAYKLDQLVLENGDCNCD